MAKVTVSFVTSQQDEDIRIESDPERNTDYSGSLKRKFLYGDTAYFRVYSSAPHLLSVCSTDGDITDMGIYSEDVKNEPAVFITGNTAKTEKPVTAVTAYRWLGNSLGGISTNGIYAVAASESPDPAEGLIASVGLDYRTSYRLYGLTPPKKGVDEYPVTVYVRYSDV